MVRNEFKKINFTIKVKLQPIIVLSYGDIKLILRLKSRHFQRLNNK